MLKAAISFLVIPIAGLITAQYLIGLIEAELVDSFSIRELCSLTYFELSREFADPKAVNELCETFIQPILIMEKASLISLIVAVSILIAFRIASSFCGTNRNKNALVFPKLVPLTVLIIAAQVLVQGLILAYLSYLVPVEIIGIYYPAITFLIGGGAAIGFYQVASSLISFFRSPQHVEKGMVLDKKSHPKIWAHVESIANRIEARKPDNIVVGLQPTFYATSANVKLFGYEDELEGETLFLSLSLMKLFERDELDAVIGHELGHFKAEDTNYSTKFAPVYSNLGKSIDNLTNTTSAISALAKLPAIFVLSAMYDTFASNIASISREREFQADIVGCEASSKEGLVYSLAKVVTYSNLWNETLVENVNRLNNGRITANLSEVFRESSLYNIGNKDVDEIIDDVLPSIVKHPTDSHPPLAERYKNIDFDVKKISREKIITQGDATSDLIDDSSKLEEELTVLEHRYQVALGIANIPEESQYDEFAGVIYALAASMIGADGKLENDEVKVAEDIGVQILDNFDRVEFRNFIDNLEKIPNFEEVARTCINFKEENKIVIYNYLEAIANADGDLAKDEKKLLDDLKNIWSI